MPLVSKSRKGHSRSLGILALALGLRALVCFMSCELVAVKALASETANLRPTQLLRLELRLVGSVDLVLFDGSGLAAFHALACLLNPPACGCKSKRTVVLVDRICHC